MLNMWMLILIFILAVSCVFIGMVFILFSDSETWKELDRKMARKIRGEHE